jgi:uncharacterized membrane protein
LFEPFHIWTSKTIRENKLEEKQQDALNQDKNFTTLTKFIGLTPSCGILAKHNKYRIGDGLFETVIAQVEMEEQKKKRISNQNTDINTRKSVRLQIAFANGTTLTRRPAWRL